MKNRIIYLIVMVFACLSLKAQQVLTKYEYWLDTDFAGRTTLQLSAGDSIATHIVTGSKGLHNLHYRVLQRNGLWSSVVSQLYFYVDASISAYEYWLDSSYVKKTVVVLPAPTTATNFTLPNTIFDQVACGTPHSFHIRFKQSNGEWSYVFSERLPPLCTASAITAYRYWFDADFAAVQIVTNTSVGPIWQSNLLLNTTGLKPGSSYQLHTQFKDKQGNWSVVLSKAFTYVGIKELNSYIHYQLSPNPNKGIFSVQFNNLPATSLQINVLDMNGKVIYSRLQKSVSGVFTEAIQLNDQPGGTYILQLKSGLGDVETKFVID